MEIKYSKQEPGVSSRECMSGNVYHATSREGSEMGIYLCAENSDGKRYLIDLADGRMAPVEAWPTTRFNPCDAVAHIQD